MFPCFMFPTSAKNNSTVASDYKTIQDIAFCNWELLRARNFEREAFSKVQCLFLQVKSLSSLTGCNLIFKVTVLFDSVCGGFGAILFTWQSFVIRSCKAQEIALQFLPPTSCNSFVAIRMFFLAYLFLCSLPCTSAT